MVSDNPTAGPIRRAVLWTVLGAAALGGGVVFYRHAPRARPNAPARDPRLDYAGPFRNVNPAVRYVSDDLCAGCHPDQARDFARHPMGRSLVPIARAKTLPLGRRHHNPFDAQGSHFWVERQGKRVRHHRALLDAEGNLAADQVWQVHYALGSGTRGYSYLTDRDGYLFETPVSWFRQKKVWDLSPGFGPNLLTGRPVVADCLFCHANRAGYVEGTLNRYTRPVFDGHAIGCQRCHGPGELHVATPTAAATIVNPRRLEPALREAVCQQCHLTGEVRVRRRGRGLYDFRPAMPLESFWSVFVRNAAADKGAKAVSHVEQMYQSRCFRGSRPKPAARSRVPAALGCVSCHDPHRRAPKRGKGRVAFYRARCLACHNQTTSPQRKQGHRLPGCRLPRAERVRRAGADSCIHCHMPRYRTSDIAHTAATDHRILRDGKTPNRRQARRGNPDALPLISFYPGRQGAEDEDERDRAVALVQLALKGNSEGYRALRHALPALDAALDRDADDWVAGEAKGHALGLLGRPSEALAAFQKVLAGGPHRELALVGAASMAEALHQTAAAGDYWKRAVAANPYLPKYRRHLVLLLVKEKAWDTALSQSRAWVRLDPLSSEARAALVRCLLASGQKKQARAEFSRIRAMDPENLGELEIRFGKFFPKN
jgi:hypothetical protein